MGDCFNMPINYKEYHPEWKKISKSIIEKAKNMCDLCNAENGEPHWKTGSKVVLTVHHIDGNKQNNSKINLIALCQRCHLRLDLAKHISNRKNNKLKNNGKLF